MIPLSLALIPLLLVISASFAAVEAALQFEEPAGVRLGPDRRARTQVFCGGTHPDRR